MKTVFANFIRNYTLSAYISVLSAYIYNIPKVFRDDSKSNDLNFVNNEYWIQEKMFHNN